MAGEVGLGPTRQGFKVPCLTAWLLSNLADNAAYRLNYIKDVNYYPDNGGPGRDRTGGLLVANEALSQLSYRPFADAVWCPRSDLNRHGVAHRILSPARLPVSPQGQLPKGISLGGYIVSNAEFRSQAFFSFSFAAVLTVGSSFMTSVLLVPSLNSLSICESSSEDIIIFLKMMFSAISSI